MLNYGDAVAHLHIARRVLDSHRPGLTQLGSVWLPLPHLLLIPFVGIYDWWANGLAGMIPSAIAFLAGCTGIYRLARHWLRPAPAALALAFFALNPNLLYLQSTAMTEPIYICETIWVSLWLVEWRASLDRVEGATDAGARSDRLLWFIAAALVAAVFTRYDGWVMALLVWAAIGIMLARRGRLRSSAFWIASALVLAAPVAWCVYNATVFGDWLDFLRGPYSAKAIEMRTATPGWPPHPGWHNPWVSLLFYVKVAELDAAVCGNTLLVLSLLGTAWAWMIARQRALAGTLLLWLPVPFYAYSVAYGSVPIFIPPWWPHSWYNTRYGLELLPAFALGIGFAAHFVLGAVRKFKPVWTRYAAVAMFTLVALNAWLLLRGRPLVYVEGTKNIDARRSYDQAIPAALRAQLAMRPGGVILMDTSVYPEIVAFTGIPLRQTINESDKEFYRAALAAPATHAALVLAFDGDEVDSAVKAHPQGLSAVQRFTAPWQKAGTLYASGSWPSTTTPAR